jgi:hypothetical protein
MSSFTNIFTTPRRYVFSPATLVKGSLENISLNLVQIKIGYPDPKAKKQLLCSF